MAQSSRRIFLLLTGVLLIGAISQRTEVLKKADISPTPKPTPNPESLSPSPTKSQAPQSPTPKPSKKTTAPTPTAS